MIMKVKKCPKCGSENFIKKGLDGEKQRYFCKECKKYFQPKIALPSWVKKAYNDYVFKSIILVDLSIKYNKSIKTIVKYFDILNNVETKEYIDKVNNKEIPPISVPISLILDATFFKRK